MNSLTCTVVGVPFTRQQSTVNEGIRQGMTEFGMLVSRCFKPSQPQRIISGLRDAFIMRYIAERTNKAEIRPEEQSEKAGELSGEFME